MGWASRLFRGLLGGGSSGKKGTSPSGSGEPKPGKEKKRWGFGKSFREKDPVRPPTPPVQRGTTPRRTYASSDDGGDEQNKRAIAVAAVVRLTSSGRCLPAGAKHEEWAAVRIQAAFRGYLARRALKALRGLVKLQALVRGNIVRRQAAETLRCMQALVSVQSRARASRAVRSRQQAAAHPGASTPEKYEQGAYDGAPRHGRSGSLKGGGSSKTPGSDRLGRERSESCGRNWLDRWVEERYMDDEKNAKILEVDPGKPGHRYNTSKRRSGGGGGSHHLQSSCSTRTSEQNSRSYATIPDSPSSPPSVGMGEALSPLRMPADVAELYDSPQFFSATSRPGSSKRGGGALFTPTKSECARSLFGGYSDYPNYMANTESFRAKARSQSAPKQRPLYEKSGSLRKASAHAFAPAGAGAGAAASLHAKFTNKAYPGSGRLDRLGMPVKY